jgi:hypothetical protein
MAETPTPPATLTAAEREANRERINAIRPPQHYLKGPEEPWRAYVHADGYISRGSVEWGPVSIWTRAPG